MFCFSHALAIPTELFTDTPTVFCNENVINLAETGFHDLARRRLPAAGAVPFQNDNLTDQQVITEIFREWLSTPGAIAYLRGCASNILRARSASRANPATGGLLDGIEDGSSLEELVNDLVLFVLESFLPDAASSPDAVNLILQGKFQTFLSRAVAGYEKRALDRERSRDINPVKYLYRRFRECLARSPAFETGRLSDKATWYAVRQSGPVNGQSGAHTVPCAPKTPGINEYASWPFPALPRDTKRGQTTEKQLFRRDTLLETARFFWELAQKNGMPCKLPVRELVNYTLAHHQWLNRPVFISFDQNTRGGNSAALHETQPGPGCGGAAQGPGELLDLAASVQSVAVMAREFALSCSALECAVFLMRVSEPPMSLQEIAGKLGLKDANKANSLFRRFTNRLRRHVTEWPGAGLDDLPAQAREIFMNELKCSCKKRKP